MITATDTLTDRLCNNPSARIGLTITSNIFVNTISAAYISLISFMLRLALL